ncbi:Proline iminopeptidase [Pseudoalteromonas holothuriae]|uniref:Proline iminopeptidase n=1 Tax=Pseudoalteromonas holothuriae TaxID=2963714 RepID=A0A9W4R4P2_9GAMM|nr:MULTISPECIES: alpha/beta fold hydrolase [unclassified Pseudoalteromonas]CAH9066729.1 Proline iminopeptidase [Pseudoalteromonas sp. CIP111854]CAH9067712.1 Proline iminopeptidase [Pseudoalteromonas sp. CIP111951]
MAQGYRVGDMLRNFHFAVGEGHQIYVEEYGKADGLPVLISHGGPGSGLSVDTTQYFNPKRYRIILFSQRGCGGSTPLILDNNTPKHLIQDINNLLDHLEIKQAVFAGGSWGATLSLLFAHTYPERIKGLILWASFLATPEDLHWLYSKNGAGAQFYPESYEEFSQGFSCMQDILAYYQNALSSEDELLQHKAALHWHSWDRQVTLAAAMSRYHLEQVSCITQQAKIMCHYFSPKVFEQLKGLDTAPKNFQKIPIWFIHGRHDLVCRFAPVQRLAKALDAQLYILDGIGHSGANEAYFEAIRRAADLLACKLHT